MVEIETRLNINWEWERRYGDGTREENKQVGMGVSVEELLCEGAEEVKRDGGIFVLVIEKRRKRKRRRMWRMLVVMVNSLQGYMCGRRGRRRG